MMINDLLPAHDPYFFKSRRKPRFGKKYNRMIRNTNITKSRPYLAMIKPAAYLNKLSIAEKIFRRNYLFF